MTFLSPEIGAGPQETRVARGAAVLRAEARPGRRGEQGWDLALTPRSPGSGAARVPSDTDARRDSGGPDSHLDTKLHLTKLL